MDGGLKKASGEKHPNPDKRWKSGPANTCQVAIIGREAGSNPIPPWWWKGMGVVSPTRTATNTSTFPTIGRPRCWETVDCESCRQFCIEDTLHASRCISSLTIQSRTGLDRAFNRTAFSLINDISLAISIPGSPPVILLYHNIIIMQLSSKTFWNYPGSKNSGISITALCFINSPDQSKLIYFSVV